MIQLPVWLTAKLATIIATVLFVVGVYFYIGYLRSTIETLEANQAALISSVNQQKDVIDNLQKDFEKAQEINKDYQDKLKQIQKEAKKLEDSLYREKYGKTPIEDLIIQDKKGRIEKIINEATKDVFRCLEIISGAARQENETIKCE